MSAIGNHFYAAAAISRAANFLGVSPGDILGYSRDQALCETRFALMLAMRRRGMSLAQIGKRLSRDHTTIVHGLRKAEKLTQEPDFSNLLEVLE